jgi:segregation and condensation protein B
VPGKPALYATTREFLDYFNLKSLNELPTLAEIRDLDSINRELDLVDPDRLQAEEPDTIASPEESDTIESQEEADTIESPEEFDTIESPEESDTIESPEKPDTLASPDEEDTVPITDQASAGEHYAELTDEAIAEKRADPVESEDQSLSRPVADESE